MSVGMQNAISNWHEWAQTDEEFCVRTEMSCIYVWAHFPLKPLSSEWGIVFLPTCPKDLDKVIEINSWEMIPTSYILQMIAAQKSGGGQEEVYHKKSSICDHVRKKPADIRGAQRDKCSHFQGKELTRVTNSSFQINVNVKKNESTTSYSVYQQICNRVV